MKGTEQELIAGLHKQDPKAFDQIFDTFFPALGYFASKFTGNREDAEDIALDAMVKLWDRSKDFMAMAAVKSFLYTTTRNSCIDYFRTSKKQQKHIGEYRLTVSDESEENAEQNRIRAEVLRKLYAAIDALPEKCREVFTLSLEGYKPEEIAKKMQVTVSTVYNQKAKGMKLLQKRFSSLEWQLVVICLLCTDLPQA